MLSSRTAGQDHQNARTDISQERSCGGWRNKSFEAMKASIVLTGIGQGSPYSSVAVEALLHHHFDTELEARYQGTLLSLRYVDNLTFGVESERQGQEISDLANSILNELGFNLKPDEGCCINLQPSTQCEVAGACT